MTTHDPTTNGDFHLLLPYKMPLGTVKKANVPHYKKLIGTLAIIVPVTIPLMHFGVVYWMWEKYSHPVDHHSCSCSCWDTVFKGPYETGIASYKHVYFNVTWNTFKIWTLMVLGIIAAYECVRLVASLWFRRKLRFSMLLLLLSVLYAHYYSWWNLFNYWNDDFYTQWNHQLFFTITECISTAIVVHLLDKTKAITAPKVLVVVDVALVHVLASGWDQFVSNVMKQEDAFIPDWPELRR